VKSNTAQERLSTRVNRLAKAIPPPPREFTLSGQKLSWVEPTSTDYISHYLIRVGSDASDPKHKVSVGQTSVTMAFGESGFWISSWNEVMGTESRKIYLDDHVQEVVATDDVRRYGAIGDGRDDSAAIVACLNANGSVCFPPGFVFSTDQINVADVPSIRIYGGGTVRLVDGATGASLFYLDTIPDVQVDNVVMDGNQANNSTATADHILSCSDCASIRVVDVSIINPRQGPFTSLSPAVASQVRIQNLTVRNSGYEGVKLSVGTTGRVFASGLDISTVTSVYAFHIVNGTKHMVVGARIFGNNGGVAMWTTGTGTLVGCTITGNTNAALSFQNGVFRHVGCVLTGNGSIYASSLVAFSVLSEGVSDRLPDLLLKSATPFFEQRLVDGTLVGQMDGGSIMARGGSAGLAIKRADDSKVLTATDADGLKMWDSIGSAALLKVDANGTETQHLKVTFSAEINGGGYNAPLIVKNTGGAEALRVYDSTLVEMASAATLGDLQCAGTIKGSGGGSPTLQGGATGTFTTVDGKTVTVTTGGITSIV
jgi:hypothetical protein